MGEIWYVYMVECADSSLYTGIALDVARRVALHNQGRGAKYTRARRPVQEVYREAVGERGSALRRELEIKRLRRQEKRALVRAGRRV